MYNDLFWQNRALVVGVGGLSTTNANTPFTNQQNAVTMYNAAWSGTSAANSGTTPTPQTATGQCGDSTAKYWDIGVRGQGAPGAFGTTPLTPTYSFLTNSGTGNFQEGTSTTNDYGVNPALGGAGAAHPGSLYCDGSRVPPEAAIALQFAGWQVPPGTNESNALPAPPFQLQPAATVDEGNNWINLRWGPLSLNVVNQQNAPIFTFSADPASGSLAVDFVKRCLTTQNSGCTGTGNGVNPAWTAAPSTDFYGNPRKGGNSSVDVGAVEFAIPNFAVVSVSPSSVTFPNTAVGSTSAAQTLTVSNTGGAAFTGLTVTGLPANGFARSGGTCTGTLNGSSTCTILVTFTPGALGTVGASVSVTGSVAVTGSPVGLTGTGVAAVSAATLTPTSWTVSRTRNCPGTGILGQLACSLDGSQTFTLTNTGNVTLSPIPTGVLGGVAANVQNYAVVGSLLGFGSTCGNTVTTLAPGATCTVLVQFKPLTTQAVGLKAATISVTAGAAGTLTSTLNGTAQ